MDDLASNLLLIDATPFEDDADPGAELGGPGIEEVLAPIDRSCGYLIGEASLYGTGKRTRHEGAYHGRRWAPRSTAPIRTARRTTSWRVLCV